MIIAICVATPFQSLNAINLAMHSLDDSIEKILFYRNYSAITEKILQGISQYTIFDEIYEYDFVKKDTLPSPAAVPLRSAGSNKVPSEPRSGK